MDGPWCTISYCGEAHESAAAQYARLKDYCVRVTPTEGEPFDAIVGECKPADEDGQYKVVLHPTDEDGEPFPDEAPRTLDIYDDIEGVMVY